jgi:quinol monooxygenase YgiN
MSAKIVAVIASFQAQPGKEAELKKALLALVGPTRKEPGCINYDLHVAAEDPTKFIFHENWTSKAHLDSHLRNAHVQVILPRLEGLCVGMPEIVLWDKVA